MSHNEWYLSLENPNGCPEFAERMYNAEMALKMCCGERGARHIMRSYGGKNLVLGAIAEMEDAHNAENARRIEEAQRANWPCHTRPFRLQLDALILNGKPISEDDRTQIARWQDAEKEQEHQRFCQRLAREQNMKTGPDGEDDTVDLTGVFHRHQLLGGRPRLYAVPAASHVARQEGREAGNSEGMSP